MYNANKKGVMDVKWKKISIIVIVVLAVVVGGGALLYRTLNSQSVIEAYGVNTSEASHKVLIATQGSSFKKTVLKEIASYYEGKDIYIEVVDATKLDEVDMEHWEFVQILSTIESGKPLKEVSEFLSYYDSEKCAVYYTSGSGKYNNSDSEIQVITSASSGKNVDDCVDSIIKNLSFIEL